MFVGVGLTRLMQEMRNDFLNNWDPIEIFLLLEDFTETSTATVDSVVGKLQTGGTIPWYWSTVFAAEVVNNTTYASILGTELSRTNDDIVDWTIYGWMSVDYGSGYLFNLKHFPVPIPVPIGVQFRFQPELRYEKGT